MSHPPIGHDVSDPFMHRPIPHTEFGIRKLEMLMPWHRMMERDRAGQLDGAAWSGPKKSLLLPTFLLDAG